MKSLVFGLVFVAVGAFTSLASASPTYCYDPNVADHKYLLYLDSARETVELRKNVITGSQTVETLPCTLLESDPLAISPGQPVMKCRSAKRVDHGFVVTVNAKDCSGDVTAQVSEAWLGGTHVIGNLVCK